jgi:SAICAR synthetase
MLLHPSIASFNISPPLTHPLILLPIPDDCDDGRRKGISDKGRVLTELSLFWFDKLRDIIPNHVVTSRIEDMPEELHKHREQLEGRSILVKKAKVIPLEAIVRGYITGEVSFFLNRVRIYSVLSFSRFCMGRIQKVWYGAWDPASRGPPRITEAPHPALYALHKS